MPRAIRQYKGEDLVAVLGCWESASLIAHPFLTEAFMEQERYNIANVYMPNAETWVAQQDGDVIGFISLIGSEVGAIFVRPEFQGTGAGRALMDKARELRGDLEVEVFKANSIGRRFYARCGFEHLSESVHEQTGNKLLRLRLVANQPT